jgi:hypothetical protein
MGLAHVHSPNYGRRARFVGNPVLDNCCLILQDNPSRLNHIERGKRATLEPLNSASVQYALPSATAEDDGRLA